MQVRPNEKGGFSTKPPFFLSTPHGQTIEQVCPIPMPNIQAVRVHSGHADDEAAGAVQDGRKAACPTAPVP